jgi:hypothetical protein
MTRIALELIGRAGLGHSFDALDSDETPAYIASVKQLLWVSGCEICVQNTNRMQDHLDANDACRQVHPTLGFGYRLCQISPVHCHKFGHQDAGLAMGKMTTAAITTLKDDHI